MSDVANPPSAAPEHLPDSFMGLQFPLTEIYPSEPWREDLTNENGYYGAMSEKPVEIQTPESGVCFSSAGLLDGPQGDGMFMSDIGFGTERYRTGCLGNDTGALSRTEITSSPVTICTPELDAEISYDTPSTICVETPPVIEKPPVEGFKTPNTHEVSKTSSPGDIILDLLRSCKISRKRARRPSSHDASLESLDDRRMMNVIKADSLLLTQNPEKLLKPLLDKWDIDKSLSLPVLGLPARWKGVQAAVDYLRLLDAAPQESGLDPIPRRLGHMLLYLNYKELCEATEEHYPLIPGK